MIYKKDYFGFVYIWFDRKHKRFYVGSHWGRVDDGYVCSSSWMKQAYKHRPKDFRRKILYYEKTNDRKTLLDEERRYLSMMKDNELCKRYYNRARVYCMPTSNDLKKGWNEERKQKWKIQMEEWRKNDPNWKDKISAQKGKKLSEDQIRKLKEARLKKGISNETRKIMSEKAKARKQGEINKKLHAEKRIGMYGKKHSEETKKKISEGQFRKRWPKKN